MTRNFLPGSYSGTKRARSDMGHLLPVSFPDQEDGHWLTTTTRHFGEMEWPLLLFWPS
jgi:hypothetical protein